jgi:hypothetical protein
MHVRQQPVDREYVVGGGVRALPFRPCLGGHEAQLVAEHLLAPLGLLTLLLPLCCLPFGVIAMSRILLRHVTTAAEAGVPSPVARAEGYLLPRQPHHLRQAALATYGGT